MTEVPVVLDDLVHAREELVADAVGRMPDAHRRFLLSFEKGEPGWALLDVSNVAKLPAVRWRMENLARLDGQRRTELVARLEEALAQHARGVPVAGTGDTEGWHE